MRDNPVSTRRQFRFVLKRKVNLCSIGVILLQQLKGRPMKISRRMATATALSSVLALGLALNSTAASAAAKEKCYGVAKAGQNDCATSNSSCVGTSTEDGQTDAFTAVPTGLCERLSGGSLTSS
jgi:uncharacterized membrane protein